MKCVLASHCTHLPHTLRSVAAELFFEESTEKLLDCKQGLWFILFVKTYLFLVGLVKNIVIVLLIEGIIFANLLFMVLRG